MRDAGGAAYAAEVAYRQPSLNALHSPLLTKVLVVLLAAAAFASPSAGAATSEAQDLEVRVHTPFRIFCEDGPMPIQGETGYAVLDAGEAHLVSAACEGLRLRPGVSDPFARSLLVLLHELNHLAWQSRDEGAVECFALFMYRYAAQHWFGLSRSAAQADYLLAWRAHQALPPQYQPSYCRFLARDPLR